MSGRKDKGGREDVKEENILERIWKREREPCKRNVLSEKKKLSRG